MNKVWVLILSVTFYSFFIASAQAMPQGLHCTRCYQKPEAESLDEVVRQGWPRKTSTIPGLAEISEIQNPMEVSLPLLSDLDLSLTLREEAWAVVVASDVFPDEILMDRRIKPLDPKWQARYRSSSGRWDDRSFQIDVETPVCIIEVSLDDRLPSYKHDQLRRFVDFDHEGSFLNPKLKPVILYAHNLRDPVQIAWLRSNGIELVKTRDQLRARLNALSYSRRRW